MFKYLVEGADGTTLAAFIGLHDVTVFVQRLWGFTIRHYDTGVILYQLVGSRNSERALRGLTLKADQKREQDAIYAAQDREKDTVQAAQDHRTLH